MKKFAIIGLAGFVAKKHVNCIKRIKGNLVAALDFHDNVGFIDNEFPKCRFFTKEKNFFLFLKKNVIDYVVICSPSYLHYKHIKKSLLSNSNVIVEKPPILRPVDYKKIIKIEKDNKKKCFCIFQLRLDKKLEKLKKYVEKDTKNFNVEIVYYTYRGDWYFKSWKNNKFFSGGLLVNIAIHFFDILFWIFGKVKEFQIIKKSDSEVKGLIKLEKASVKWTVSIKNINKKNNKIKNRFHRVMKVNDKVINFDKFDNLHLANYKEIMKGNFHISNFENVIKFLPQLK
ncbi:Gfo/Idh/MocA family oxidoreductase [Candidatus Pelagibacter sp.]|nr:Gfo/Idh/MocA family oxidoreductase [Candidatus Pelagibacter sp.]